MNFHLSFLSISNHTNSNHLQWMIFCSPTEVNEVWSAIAKYTSTNSLGIAAKVAPNDGSVAPRGVRLICVYTEDFSDKLDVYRVLKAIKDLGLVDKTQKGSIFYKAGTFFFLHLIFPCLNPAGKPSNQFQ